MNAEELCADSPTQPKPSLTRCAACYNQRAGSMPHRGGGGDSSSSAEDSGPDVGWQSEAESSSSSSSVEDLSEEPDEPETATTSAAAAEAESGGGDEDGGASESQEDKSRTKVVTQRAPLVKSFSSSSSSSSLTPHLAPLTLLPRPQTVVSTLRLQVLPQTHDDDNPLFVEQQEEKAEERGGREEVNGLLHPPTGLPWQPFTLHHHHQQQQQHLQPQHFPPLSAQGQRLPPPPLSHTLPVPHLPMLHTHLQAPHTHLHTLADPHLCWYCYSMQFPYSPHWSLYGAGHSPR